MVLKPHVEQEQEHEMIREQLYRWGGGGEGEKGEVQEHEMIREQLYWCVGERGRGA